MKRVLKLLFMIVAFMTAVFAGSHLAVIQPDLREDGIGPAVMHRAAEIFGVFGVIIFYIRRCLPHPAHPE